MLLIFYKLDQTYRSLIRKKMPNYLQYVTVEVFNYSYANGLLRFMCRGISSYLPYRTQPSTLCEDMFNGGGLIVWFMLMFRFYSVPL